MTQKKANALKSLALKRESTMALILIVIFVLLGTGIFFVLNYGTEETGLSRPSLYKALSDGAKPQFSTIMKVLKAVGGQIRVNPLST